MQGPGQAFYRKDLPCQRILFVSRPIEAGWEGPDPWKTIPSSRSLEAKIDTRIIPGYKYGMTFRPTKSRAAFDIDMHDRGAETPAGLCRSFPAQHDAQAPRVAYACAGAAV